MATERLGSLVVVTGDAGIGKTRLCQELTARARDAGIAVVMARCWDHGGSPALWPWQPILGELCGSDAVDLLVSDVDVPAGEHDRFARFAAVTDEIAAACSDRPSCVVIDDIHAADVGTLLLTRFVARSLHRLDLALVLTRRRSEPALASLEASLIDEIEREATLLTLPGFDLAETAEFLATYGLDDLDTDSLRVVLRATNGHPLFLRRIVASGISATEGAASHGLRAAIQAAISRMTPETQRVLKHSAVLGTTPSLPEAAAVSATAPASVMDAVAEAASAGLVTEDGPDRFAFSHELLRSALEDALDGNERLAAHARAAAALGGTGPSVSADRLARRAHHALAAAPRSPDDAREAVAACQAAAQSMVDGFAYEHADTLLSAAVGLSEQSNLGTPPGELLVAWAQAALLCGRLAEAHVRFDRAAAVVERAGDPLLFAEAALGLGSHWVNGEEYRDPVERGRVLGLQRAALARLPDEQAALRCRLTARLAAEAVYDGGPADPVFEALEAARHCGDRAALAEALSLCHRAVFPPHEIRARLDLADELVDVASETGHGMLALMGLCLRAIDLFHLGDDRAFRALEDLRARADALACQSILYVVDVLDVMLLIRAGRLDEAEVEAQRSFERGRAVGDVDAVPYLGAHTLLIRWCQGRHADVLDAVDEMAWATGPVREFAFPAFAASIAARAGLAERARSVLDRLTANGLAGLPRSSVWLPGMVAIVQAAAALGDEAIAREAYDLLVPFADLPVLAASGVVCLGSTERPLGLAAATWGDHDLAVRHLERAIAANRRLGNRPMLAITRAELATVLRQRGGAEDRARAIDLLHRAARESGAMDMSGWTEEWRAELSALEPAGTPGAGRTQDGADRGDAATGARHGVIRRAGRGWLVEIGDRRAVVADLLGMSYIAELLTRPGQHISALTLAAGAAVMTERARHELLDDQARTAYAARARELSDELAEAEANADIARAEHLRGELDALAEEIEAATGLGGRPRAFMDHGELARTSVRKAIKRAIDAIDARDHSIADALRSCVSTGSTCSYTPDPRRAVVWSTASSAPATAVERPV